MFIQIPRDDLVSCLQTVSRAVPTRSVIPSLAGVLLEAIDGVLRVTGNDLEISITAETACLVREPGEAVIPARLLTEAVRRSPEESVSLQLIPERNVVQLVSGMMQMDILTLSAEEFPETASFHSEHEYTIPQVVVKNMIRQIDFAISSEDLRPVLTGAHWSFAADELRMTALDGYRLASRWSRLPLSGAQPAQVVVPAKALRELIRLLQDDQTELAVQIGSTFVSFQFSNTRLVSRLLEGQFPNTDQFMPKSYQTRVVLNATHLLAAIERAALVSKEGAMGSVKLTVERDKMAVSAQSMDIGRHYEELAIQTTGDELQIMYKIKALADLLRSAECEEVVLDFHGSFGPGILRPVGQDNYVGLLMPLRLN